MVRWLPAACSSVHPSPSPNPDPDTNPDPDPEPDAASRISQRARSAAVCSAAVMWKRLEAFSYSEVSSEARKWARTSAIEPGKRTAHSLLFSMV
ncbi:hypothetical protein M5D96_010038 [Drosophila gunungcola]|uniref:Uncharacterized protein n=1 Tax=Drosophila gunungcola TaxID=103775 RepID=A0A9P9YHZ6_9MUSC|nr:hypothetical protein M5D96_010038 [Drosophila gunungcola]